MLRRIILFLIPLLVLTILFLLIVLFVNRDSGKGALKVTSNIGTQIFLDGKYIGKSPLCLCELPQLIKTGDYDIKLVPTIAGFPTTTQKVPIYKGVLTVLDKTLEKNSSQGTQSLITLEPLDDEKSTQILVISFPSKAQVVLDSNIVGTTPILIKSTTPSDHEIQVIKDGYKEKDLRVKGVQGKRLDITVTLGVNNLSEPAPVASKSAEAQQNVTILSTPTGFLRVRENPSVSSAQVGEVTPGEHLEVIAQREGWYEIKLKDGKTGWISSDYAKNE